MGSIWENISSSIIKNNCYCCKLCLIELKIRPCIINNNKTKIFFCNTECRKYFLNKRKLEGLIEVKCEFCGHLFCKTKYNRNRVKTHFCSTKCHKKYESIKHYKKRVSIECKNCNIIYNVPICKLVRKKNIGNFCSKKCLSIFRDLKVKFICEFCFKETKTFKSIYNRAVHHFCSSKCSSRYYCGKNICESIFEQEILKINGLKYEKNNREILGRLELDFYFPCLNIGVEINGPTHYLPIYGNYYLQKQKDRDALKLKLCKEKNIKLISIPVLDVKVLDYEKVFSFYIDEIRKNHEQKRTDN